MNRQDTTAWLRDHGATEAQIISNMTRIDQAEAACDEILAYALNAHAATDPHETIHWGQHIVDVIERADTLPGTTLDILQVLAARTADTILTIRDLHAENERLRAGNSHWTDGQQAHQ